MIKGGDPNYLLSGMILQASYKIYKPSFSKVAGWGVKSNLVGGFNPFEKY